MTPRLGGLLQGWGASSRSTGMPMEIIPRLMASHAPAEHHGAPPGPRSGRAHPLGGMLGATAGPGTVGHSVGLGDAIRAMAGAAGIDGHGLALNASHGRLVCKRKSGSLWPRPRQLRRPRASLSRPEWTGCTQRCCSFGVVAQQPLRREQGVAAGCHCCELNQGRTHTAIAPIDSPSICGQQCYTSARQRLQKQCSKAKARRRAG